MLSDSRFWFGFIVGVGGVYAYHRFKGIPSNAPGSNKSA
jgi:hypothetical protein